MDTLVFWFLVLFLIVAVFPIATWVSLARAKARLAQTERAVERQRETIEELKGWIGRLQSRVVQLESASHPTEKTVAAPEPVAARLATPPPAVASPPLEAPAPAARPAETQPSPAAEPVRPAAAPVPQPVLPPVPPRRVPAAPAAEPPRSFDWESLIGVRLFAAVAGISMLIAAMVFLKIAAEHGYLGPPVRVVIGVLTAIALLVVCELKAARQYPATANAMDAAAVAILFSTFFAAHSLWNLISGPTTFALLAVVTALAVWLSTRRDSIFIAVLGLLGGFLSPALLSTGENQPATLFSYLLLLNAGLAWVAYRKRWPALTVLSGLLTALYQWGWVIRFLHESSLTMAMGIFLVFPVLAMAGLLLGNRRRGPQDDAAGLFERAGLIVTALPLTFGLCLAAIPNAWRAGGVALRFSAPH